MPSFQLDKQPWIPVIGEDGQASEKSLREVFSEACTTRELTGTPLEVGALTRFLLAICHLTETPTTLKRWGELWEARGEFMGRCAEYVARQGDVWDLFHSEHPFGQDQTLDKTLNPAHILVYEAARKNNAVFLDHSEGGNPAEIPAAKLARGLITTNAYGGSSGGDYRSGPLAMRTIGIVCGRDLAETLLLNLIVQNDPPLTYDWRSYGAIRGAKEPFDIVRRYLWTSRRVLLKPEPQGLGARTMLLAPGNEMPEDERKRDPMVVMRKDAKGKDLVPLPLEAGRALWRSAHVLLSSKNDEDSIATIRQLSNLELGELITAESPLSMRVCAVAGKAQGPKSEWWRDERLPFGLSVIYDDARYTHLERAVSWAEDGASEVRTRLRRFCQRYLQGGSSASPDREDVKRLLNEIAPNLADYWGVLAMDGERIATDGFDEEAWSNELRVAKDSAFRKAVERLPATARRYVAEFAVVGRTKRGANL